MGKVLAGPSIRELADIMLTMMSGSADGDDAEADGGASAGGAMTPLEVGPRAKRFPLSEAQQRLLAYHREHPLSPHNIRTFAARVTPPLDPKILEKAVEFIASQHPMLRTTMHDLDGVPWQRTNGYVAFLSHEVGGLSAEEVQELVEQRAASPFDLSSGSLSRVELILTGTSCLLLVACHPIAADRHSLAIVIRDLFSAYDKLAAGEPPVVEPAKHAYQDFIGWEQTNLSSDASRKKLEFLKSELDGAPALLSLPTTRQSGPAGSLKFRLPATLSYRLMSMAAEQDVTLFTTLLSSYELLLHHICGQNDLLVGCTYAGRQHTELRDMVGQFENNVVLRSTLADDPTFVDLLATNRQKIERTSANQQYPFSRLKNRLVLPESDRHPIYQASFEMEKNASLDPRAIASFLLGNAGHQCQMGQHQVVSMDAQLQRTPCELTLAVEEAGGSLLGNWQYDGLHVTADMAATLHEQFLGLLEQVVENPLTRISAVQLGPEDAVPFKSWTGATEENAIVTLSGDGWSGKIDPIAESTLDPTIVAPADPSYDFHKVDRIFLTGATGFVGAFLDRQTTGCDQSRLGVPGPGQG